MSSGAPDGAGRLSVEVMAGRLADRADLDGGAIDLDTPIGDLGFESLALVEWFFGLEDDFGIEIDDVVVERLDRCSLRELHAAIGPGGG